MKNKTQIFIILLIIMVTLAACRYDEGPMISFRSVENRIGKEFDLVEFTKNDIDLTQELADSCGMYWGFHDSKATFFPNTFYVYGSYYGIEQTTMGGDWRLIEKNKKIEFISKHNYHGIEPFQNNILTIWRIHRLTKEEFWLSCDYNGSYYYLKLQV